MARLYNLQFQLLMTSCPRLGQDRVNFHQKPGGDTAGQADPTWPNRAGYSIPCTIKMGSGWGELGGGKAVAAGERTVAAAGESGSVRSAVCVVYSPYLYSPYLYCCCYCSLCLLFC